MKKKFNVNILSTIIISYLLLALVWWTILLLRKNEKAYLLQSDNIKLYQEKTLGINEYDISKDKEYLSLTDAYSKQRMMIIGEGAFFAISMIIGVILILRSSKRTIEINKQQNNFLLAVTHELKTPVAAIKLILQTILKRNLNKEQLKSFASNALRENQRLEGHIDNILLSTKLADGYHYHMEKLDYQEFVQSIVNLHNQRMVDRNIVLRAIDRKKTQLVQLDTNAMAIALNNLIDNAIKYSQSDIYLTLEVIDPLKKIKLNMEDTGAGIQAEDKPRIFDKFYRGGSEETRSTNGTGLGLYLTKEIVEAHNGEIRYEKRTPKGSTFSIILDISV